MAPGPPGDLRKILCGPQNKALMETIYFELEQKWSAENVSVCCSVKRQAAVRNPDSHLFWLKISVKKSGACRRPSWNNPWRSDVATETVLGHTHNGNHQDKDETLTHEAKFIYEALLNTGSDSKDRATTSCSYCSKFIFSIFSPEQFGRLDFIEATFHSGSFSRNKSKLLIV